MPAAPAVRLRRTWPQRILIGFNLILIFALLTGAGGIGYFYWRFGQLPRIEVDVEEATGPAFNVLLVGSDSREGVADEEAGMFGRNEVTGQRADTIILLRVDPAAQKAALMSIPRDLFVPIAQTSRRDRINTAFQNGPDQLIQTIRQAFDVEVNHYVQIDFNGFRRVVDIVGGVPIYFPGPARDRYSGLDIPNGGCHELPGGTALAYVRARHYQYYEAGRWRSDPTGDYGRISRQQDFIRRLMREVVDSGPADFAQLNRLIEAGIDNVQIDDQLSFNRMVQLAKRFRSLDPGQVDMLTVPTRPANVGGASVLLMNEDEAQEVLARFRPEPEPAGPAFPSETTVRVLNGTGRSGEAGRAAEAFQAVDFRVLEPGDAGTYGADRTRIAYAPGQVAKAQLVERHLLAGGEIVEDRDLTGTDVVVVTGLDYAGVSAEPRPAGETAATTTSTTAPETPSTTVEAQGADPASQC